MPRQGTFSSNLHADSLGRSMAFAIAYSPRGGQESPIYQLFLDWSIGRFLSRFSTSRVLCFFLPAHFGAA